MRWRLILEEFGPDIKHIKGEDNIVADAISRLPMSEMNVAEYGYFATEDDEEEFPLNLHLVRECTNQELNENLSALKKIVND